jgi:5-formyltetrahydrofolate cyclo-ligase
LDDISERKTEIRRLALERRAASPIERQGAALALAEHGRSLIATLKPAEDPLKVSGFYPIRDEIDVLPLLAALRQSGAHTLLPATHPGPRLTFHLWDGVAPLRKAPFGLKEPFLDWPSLVPDVMLVPLLAFDRRGTRIGYGAGYYDAALREVRASKAITAIGIAYAAQEFENLPEEPHDEPLDYIITPDAIIRCGP